MKKASYCSMNGFKKLQAALLNEAEVKCESCIKLLEMCGYTRQKHDEAVSAWLNGDERVARGADVTEDKERDGKQKKARDGEDEPEKKGAAHDDCTLSEDNGEAHDGNKKSDDGISPAEKLEQLFEEFSPIIKILPAGTRNKKVPYQCTVCRTRRFPKGNIGELSKRKYKTCRHFLLKHVRSPMHQRYLRLSETASVPITVGGAHGEVRPCPGLCVNDPHNAGKLYTFREEFRIWASYANLAECSVHKYWHEVSENAWYIRAKDCEEETDQMSTDGKFVCGQCKALGYAHSVPTHVNSGKEFQKIFL